MKLLDRNERKKVLRDEINRIVGIIKKEYKPDKIILFGSMAKGEVDEWSDIDLLIVKDTEKRPVDRSIEICKLIHPNVGIDLFVYTPEEYDALIKEKFSLMMNILREGKVLYEKGNRRVAKNRS
ncbi:MAG: nucleotidyltransferase domain-containing protein [Thermodesulfobacteriota bacterium]